MMGINEIRQSSVVQGVGPGSLTVLQDGSTVIIPGVDAWFISANGYQNLPHQAMLQDKLLAENLGVEFFVQPPAQRLADEADTDYLQVSLFPKWVVCYSCGNTFELGISEPKRPKCQQCSDKGNNFKQMVQVNFVVACENGHLDDFPWKAWVHRGSHNICSTPKLTFKAKGAVSLSDQRISCSCGKSRNLQGTNEPDTLKNKLSSDGEEFLCTGARPWLRDSVKDCDKPMRMVLRSSNNLYFASTTSSILVPTSSTAPAEVYELVKNHHNSGSYLFILMANNYDYSALANTLPVIDSKYYKECSVSDLALALSDLYPNPDVDQIVDTSVSTPFDRTPEWNALQTAREHDDLIVRPQELAIENSSLLASLIAIPKLKKTSALKGFSRLDPTDIPPAQGRRLLRRNPFEYGSNWFPAVRHTGEGIFLSLDNAAIKKWQSKDQVINRISRISSNLADSNKEFIGAELSPKLVLLHTLSHALINELVIECGYTSAALAERVYGENDQAGLLIYTASADSDGTMGGLVEMARPEVFIPVMQRAIDKSHWCSNDPVCMELGNLGQGTYGANLSACHNCSLIPETACEFFNLGLDRALLIGDVTGKFDGIGFFES